MSTIYGDSPEIPINSSYGRDGGISLYSVGDGEGGTITGGSGDSEGEQQTSARIRWAITVDAEGNYVTGGITGSADWMRGTENSPFTGYTDQELADIAVRDGNLNAVFLPWNADHNVGDIFRFMAAAWDAHPGCVQGFAG